MCRAAVISYELVSTHVLVLIASKCVCYICRSSSIFASVVGRDFCFDCVMNVIVILSVFGLCSHHHFILPLSIFNTRAKGGLLAASISANQTLVIWDLKVPCLLILNHMFMVLY